MSAGQKSRRILVVEDDSSGGPILEGVLKWLGYETILAKSGQEALTIVKSGSEKLDLVLTDNQMPKMTGTVLAKELKKAAADLQIVMLTASTVTDAELKRQADDNLRGILRKPYDILTLKYLLNEILPDQSMLANLDQVEWLVLDLGGTLMREDWEGGLRNVGAEFGIQDDIPLLQTLLISGEQAQHYQRDPGYGEEYWRYVLENLGTLLQERLTSSSADVEQIRAFNDLAAEQKKQELLSLLMNIHDPIPGVLGMIRDLKSRGYKPVIYTDENPEFVQALTERDDFAWLKEFPLITSTALATRKSEAGAYDRLLEHLKTQFHIASPSQVLIVDDEQKNVEAAEQVGFFAVHAPQNAFWGRDSIIREFLKTEAPVDVTTLTPDNVLSRVMEFKTSPAPGRRDRERALIRVLAAYLRTNSEPALTTVKRILQDTDPDIRTLALAALSGFMDWRSPEILLEAVRQDSDAFVQRRALSFLKMNLRELSRVIDRMPQDFAERFFSKFLTTVQDFRNRADKIFLVDALDILPDVKYLNAIDYLGVHALPILKELLGDEEEAVRRKTIWALEAIGNEEALAALRQRASSGQEQETNLAYISHVLASVPLKAYGDKPLDSVVFKPENPNIDERRMISVERDAQGEFIYLPEDVRQSARRLITELMRRLEVLDYLQRMEIGEKNFSKTRMEIRIIENLIANILSGESSTEDRTSYATIEKRIYFTILQDTLYSEFLQFLKMHYMSPNVAYPAGDILKRMQEVISLPESARVGVIEKQYLRGSDIDLSSQQRRIILDLGFKEDEMMQYWQNFKDSLHQMTQFFSPTGDQENLIRETQQWIAAIETTDVHVPSAHLWEGFALYERWNQLHGNVWRFNGTRAEVKDNYFLGEWGATAEQAADIVATADSLSRNLRNYIFERVGFQRDRNPATLTSTVKTWSQAFGFWKYLDTLLSPVDRKQLTLTVRLNGRALPQREAESALSESRWKLDEIFYDANTLVVAGSTDHAVLSQQDNPTLPEAERIVRAADKAAAEKSPIRLDASPQRLNAIANQANIGGAADSKKMTSVGGIDLNPAHLNLQIKRDGNGVPLPMTMQPAHMDIEGFLPVIIEVTPARLPLLLGLDDKRPRKDAKVNAKERES